MRVRAKREGWDGKTLRRAGEVFDWPGQECPPWAEPLEPDRPAEPGGINALRRRAKELGVAYGRNWSAADLEAAIAAAGEQDTKTGGGGDDAPAGPGGSQDGGDGAGDGGR